MRKKYKDLIKDTLIFSVGNLGSKFILFLMVPLYTNYLTTAEYGTAELVFTIAQLMIPIASVTIWNGLIRYGLQKDKKPEDVLKDSFFIWIAGSALIICTTPILGLYSPISEWKWYLCFYAIAYIANQIELSYLKVIGKNKLFSLISIVQTFVLASLNVILIAYLNCGVRGYLVSNIAANATSVILICVIGKLYRDVKGGTTDKQLIIDMLRYSAPLILNDVSWWLVHSSDKIMIEWMVSAEALGLYTVASKIPGLVNTFIDIFSQAWGINSIKEIESSNDTRYYSQVFRFYSTLTFGAVICFVLVIKPFMSVYVGKEFVSAWQFVPLLLVAASFTAISSFYGSMFGALKKSVECMYTTLAGAFVNVIVNYYAIKLIGTWGAVVGTVCAFFVIAFSRMSIVNKYIYMEIHKLQLFFDIVLVLTQAVLVSVDWNGYAVSTVVLGCFLINHKDLLYEIKTLIQNKKK